MHFIVKFLLTILIGWVAEPEGTKTMNTQLYTLSLIALTALSACTTSRTDPGAVFFQMAEDLQDDLNSEAAFQAATNLSGTASMSGAVAFIPLSGEDVAIGDLSATADFDAETISGRASGFELYDGNSCADPSNSDCIVSITDMSGNLNMSGTIDSDAGTFANTYLTGDLNYERNGVDMTMTTDDVEFVGAFGRRQDGAGDLFAIGDGYGNVDITTTDAGSSSTMVDTALGTILLIED